MTQKKKSSPANKIFLFLFLPVLALGAFILNFSTRALFQKDTCGCLPLEEEYSGQFDPGAKIAYFQNQPQEYQPRPIKPQPENLALSDSVLGTASDQKWIEIDLSDQRLYAHENGRVVYNFLVSTGKWAPTPTGTYRVWIKLRYTKMSGGSKELGTYYYLPNVPYVMYFYKGFGIHGTYWHQNFGQPMSHGCVNMATPEAEKIFYWVSPSLPDGKNSVRASSSNPGTKVVIHD